MDAVPSGRVPCAACRFPTGSSSPTASPSRSSRRPARPTLATTCRSLPRKRCDLVGKGLFERLKELTLGIYDRLADTSAARGIILADTKLEFGFADGDLVLIDEVGTPDSSRFWPADGYVPGGAQPSFDKQFVRDWLDASGWDHEPPPPRLPSEVVEGTAARYVEAYERITGSPRSSRPTRETASGDDDPALERLREEHG